MTYVVLAKDIVYAQVPGLQYAWIGKNVAGQIYKVWYL